MMPWSSIRKAGDSVRTPANEWYAVEMAKVTTVAAADTAESWPDALSLSKVPRIAARRKLKSAKASAPTTCVHALARSMWPYGPSMLWARRAQ